MVSLSRQTLHNPLLLARAYLLLLLPPNKTIVLWIDHGVLDSHYLSVSQPTSWGGTPAPGPLDGSSHSQVTTMTILSPTPSLWLPQYPRIQWKVNIFLEQVSLPKLFIWSGKLIFLQEVYLY